MFGRSWRSARPALIAAGLALLAGTPAVLVAAKAASPWLLGGADGAAAAPVYIPRNVDGQVRELLAAGGFVLLVGDSAAGKSRAAFEAVSTLPGHVLICPASRAATLHRFRTSGSGQTGA